MQKSLLQKKVIEFGWDIPSPAYTRDNIRSMERRPFEGVIMKLPDEVGGGQLFNVELWDDASRNLERLEQELHALSQIEWGTFTDNFIVLYAASGMDWFSDADWEKVIEHVRFCARAAVAGRCAGLCWDPEPYGGINPWVHDLQPRAKEKTFDDYMDMARVRGAQFMRALVEEMPGRKFITLRLLSDMQDGSPWSTHILNVVDYEQRKEMVRQFYYGLHPAFLDGLLDEVPPDMLMTDGNEDAYYYQSPLEFYKSYHTIKQRALPFLAPENAAKYKAQVDVSQALYMDFVFGRIGSFGSTWDLAFVRQGAALTPKQRAQWFEHNAYYALTTAEEYVWCYTEQMNWWTGQGVPAGIEQALLSAKRKYAAREPLGFEIGDMLAEAYAQAKAKIEASLKRRTVTLPRLKPNAAPFPSTAVKLQPFLQNVNVRENEVRKPAPTDVWVAYDATHVHVRVNCQATEEGVLPQNRDHAHDGESLEIMLSTESVNEPIRIVVTPTSAQAQDNPPQVRVRVVPDLWSWSAEVAVPFSLLKIRSPKKGLKLRANIARRRAHPRELATWSQVVSHFDEMDHLGTWTLG